MPYKVVKVTGGYKVKKLDDGKFMSNDPLPKARAEAQLRALYANEPKSKEVSSTPTAVMGHGAGGLFSTPGIGGAVRPNRKFGKKRKPYTNITEKHLQGKHDQSTHGSWAGGRKISESSPKYQGEPEFSGLFQETFPKKGLQKKEPHEARVAALRDLGLYDDWIKEQSEEWKRRHSKKKKESQSENFTVFKDRNGQWRWITFSSTAFRDGDGEIVSTKALENDVSRADQEGNYGPLRWWHVEGADIGDCDFNMLKGRVLIESGTFRDERVAQVVKTKSKNLRVSIGFRHPATEPDSEGVFHTIRRFERSLLPAGKASNYFTRVVVKGVNNMTDLNEKVKALRSLLGDDELVDGILSSAEITEKEADGLGVAFKELAEKFSSKAKAKPPKEEESEPEEMTEEVEETEEAEEKAKKPQPKPQPKPEPEDESEEEIDLEDEIEEDEDMDEDMDEDEEKELDQSSYIGDMPVNDFVSAMSESLAHALEPYIRSVENLATEVVSVKELLTRRTKELSGQDVAVKEATTRLEKAEKELKRANARLTELEGSQPAVVKKGYSASQSEDTIISDERVKSAGPTADPFASFAENFVLKQ